MLLACAVLIVAVPLPAVADDVTGSPCSPSGDTLRYLVVFDQGTTESRARAQTGASCGTVTAYYPQITVGVATSTDPAFAERFGPDRAFSAQAQRRTHAPSRDRLSLTDPREVSPINREDEQWDMAAINARGAGRGSRDVVVGVLDSGVDAHHPDLAGAVDTRLSAGCLSGAPDDDWAPTTSPHGTHVAGIVAAADDGKGITGVAPGVRVASVKVIDDRGYVDPAAVVCGLVWAATHGMKVVNASFAIDPWGLSCSHADTYGVMYEAISRAVRYATAAGTLVIAAATNEAVNLTPARPGPASGARCDVLPAGLRDVVAVSAVRRDGVKAGYSSYGLGVVDLTAPGGDGDDCVLSTVPGGYGSLCGTSMAAPHVAGVAALVASAHPGIDAGPLRDALEQGARPTPCPTDYDLTGDGRQDAFCAGYTGYNGFYGHGQVDAVGALTAAAGE
ncbi:S8 family serine peptidase [Amycolatopsis sp. K13G38]|uniref:S8 family serine peptidase n=1 Tax=Amycolatopsis acididurans TaxID=2724524 RepID=A0ABX1JH16_9PSEU|nr:S8 family serine peptidase [Amycolatopsis acididurans]